MVVCNLKDQALARGQVHDAPDIRFGDVQRARDVAYARRPKARLAADH